MQGFGGFIQNIIFIAICKQVGCKDMNNRM